MRTSARSRLGYRAAAIEAPRPDGGAQTHEGVQHGSEARIGWRPRGVRTHRGTRGRRGRGPGPDGAQHPPVGSVRRRPTPGRRGHAGRDVRRSDAALRPGHRRRPGHLLQVRDVRGRPRRPGDYRAGAEARGDDRARRLQRPARDRPDPRRRHLGGRLDRGRGPPPARRAGALQRARRRHRRSRARRRRPDRQPRELPAQRPDRGRGGQADPGARGGGQGGTRGPARHRRLHLRHQRLHRGRRSGDRALDPQRRLRHQRAQGPVPGRGRRARGAQLSVSAAFASGSARRRG